MHPSTHSTEGAFSLPQDIRLLTTQHLVEAGAREQQHPWLIVAGWPCQDLSMAGKAAGLRGMAYVDGTCTVLRIPTRRAWQRSHSRWQVGSTHSRRERSCSGLSTGKHSSAGRERAAAPTSTRCRHLRRGCPSSSSYTTAAATLASGAQPPLC
jgi:hypothetical protein